MYRIYHTYEEDMHPYILYSEVHVAEGYVTTVGKDIRGAYPPSRCGIYHVTAALQMTSYSSNPVHDAYCKGLCSSKRTTVFPGL